MNNANQTLGEQIEKLVRTHVEALQREAAEAVRRACSGRSMAPRSKCVHSAARAAGRRRDRAELDALGERLYQEVCARPGETMSALFPVLGETPRQLSRPMEVLRRSGRVRSVGQRHQTRYYPIVMGPTTGDA